MTAPPDRGWFWPAFALVGAVTALRWALLAFDRTDLFVDEAQYWLWGRDFAFGYYSKPPLIAWLIGAVTWLAGSDAPFWVRMPGAALHGATALILGALAARLDGPRAALWVVAGYLTLPMAALGSLLLSTDTVMAPFFAGALLFHHRLLRERRAGDAALAGLMVGLACLAKYAGVYFLLGAALAALLRRDLRPKPGHAALMLAVWAAVIAPNLIWNAMNGLSTLTHTVDNIGWVEGGGRFGKMGLDGLLAFWAGQLAVAGPVMLVALLVGLRRSVARAEIAAFVLPPLVVVSLQALLDKAYANWAVSAYFAGSVLAMAVLAGHMRWRWASLLSNGALGLALPLLTLFPDLAWQGEPLLKRYLGRAELSRQIIALDRAMGGIPVVADDRDVIADLFYTGRDAGLTIHAPRPEGRPQSHYEQRYPLPADLTGPVLLITAAPPGCPATEAPLALTGAYAKTSLKAWRIDAACLNTP